VIQVERDGDVAVVLAGVDVTLDIEE